MLVTATFTPLSEKISPQGRRASASTHLAWVFSQKQFRSTETVALEGLVASIGSVGDAYDNAAAETVMELFKNETIRNVSPFRNGPLKGLADVEEVTLDWVNWYNNERLPSFLDNIPPQKFWANYYAGKVGSSADKAANMMTP